MRKGTSFFCFLFLLLQCVWANSDDFVTCEGFVQPSPSMENIQIDFSHIGLKLFSKEGRVLKDETYCSPNGYFILPIYDKGSYILQIAGPNGWSFEPSSIPIEVTDNKKLLISSFQSAKTKSSSSSSSSPATFSQEDATPTTPTSLAQGSATPIDTPSEQKNEGAGPSLQFVVTGFSVSGQVLTSDENALGGKCPEVTSSSSSSSSSSVERFSFEIGDEVVVSLHQVDRAQTAQLVAAAPTDLGSPLQTKKLARDGHYQFHNLQPGHYVITASHSKWTFEKARTFVTVVNDNAVVDEANALAVSGYDIKGSVISESEPILGVEFFLFHVDSKNNKAATGTSPFRKAQSNADGLFHFYNIPCGYYHLVPIYRTSGTEDTTNTTSSSSSEAKYDISPSEILLTVQRGKSSVVTEPFKVIGFSVSGRVVDAAGTPLPFISLLVRQSRPQKDNSEDKEGERLLTTDANGEFKLESMKRGTYDIIARHPHITFNNLMGVKLSPNVVKLSQLQAAKYDVCGRIVLPKTTGLTLVRQRKVILNGSDVLLTEVAKEDGSFCFRVKPGLYEVTPQLSQEEVRDGLQLTVPSIFVQVLPTASSSSLNSSSSSSSSVSTSAETSSKVQVTAEGPLVDGVDFEQALLSVSGTVRCLESPCDVSISVRLASVDRPHFRPVTKGLVLGSALQQQDGQKSSDFFLFGEVLPGKYVLSVEKANWCWQRQSLQVEVGLEDVTSVEFVQKGFLLSLSVPVIPTVLSMSPSSSSSSSSEETIELKKGENQFCLEKPGTYTLRSNTCHRYEKEVYVFNTSTPAPLSLQATYFRVDGKISVSGVSASTLLRLQVQAGKENHTVNVTSIDTNNANEHHYTYSVWLRASQEALLTPLHLTSTSSSSSSSSSGTSEEELLFYPRSTRVVLADEQLKSGACPAALAPFHARPGLYIKGTVSPPLENTTIQLFSKTTKELVLEVLTSSDGSYSAGPLYDDISYQVKAKKEGYQFTEKDDGSGFRTLKLSSIRIKVLLEDSTETDSRLLDGVFVSISGLNSFRSNAVTQNGGSVVFSDLFPGNYFVRPMLKEYLFDPSSKSIKLEEGVDHIEEIRAKRVAYSCYGTIRSLSGVPEAEVVVQAISSEGEVEESKTDGQGRYRLRGLLPHKSYTLLLTSHQQQQQQQQQQLQQQQQQQQPTAEVVDRWTPQNYELPPRAEKEDLTDLDFIVAKKHSNLFSLSGTVRCADPSHVPTITVQLYWLFSSSSSSAQTETLNSTGLSVLSFNEGEEGELHSERGGEDLRLVDERDLNLLDFFEFENIVVPPFDEHSDRRSLFVVLKTSLPRHSFKYAARRYYVWVSDKDKKAQDKSTLHVVLPFAPVVLSESHEVTPLPLFSLLMGISILLAAVYHEAIIEKLEEKYEQWKPKKVLNPKQPLNQKQRRLLKKKSASFSFDDDDDE